jgi:deferrochelatase/peroxidase EfeB
MSHAFVTVIAAVPVQQIDTVRSAIEALGNPAAPPIRTALDAMGVIHFASLHVFAASAGDRGHLVLEFSGDGSADHLLHELDRVLGHHLGPIFSHAVDRGTASLGEFWKAHLVNVGQTPFSNPGLNFSGVPGLSVARIHREHALFRHVASVLPQPRRGMSALDLLDTIRGKLRDDPAWSWSLHPEPLAQGGSLTGVPQGLAILPVIGSLALPFVRTFLWPFAIPTVLVFFVAWALKDIGTAAKLAAKAFAATVAFVVIAAIALYAVVRRREQAEIPIDHPPVPAAVAAIMKHENIAVQNHMAAVSVMKPGRLRRFTLSLVLWAVAQFAVRFFRPGYLGAIGTVHFARWVTVPGTADFLFLSNYAGSWESYLEDFVTKAHAGLTGIWSNTVGFPRTTNLVREGATDAGRFKRWARRQQVPTAFWYSAYPDITADNIRTNAAVRHGLGTAVSEDDARAWLALFGSQARPLSELEASEIQSIVFGGLGFLREGACVLFRLSGDVGAGKAWLAALLPDVAFADGRTMDEAIILGLSASGLRRLGLPEDCIATFSPAFVDGMTPPWRSRVLGDSGESAPANWWWGGDPDSPIDGALLLYARTASELDALLTRTVGLLEQHGHGAVARVPFSALPAKDATAQQKFQAKCEPFGFLDGVSQPVIRGTYKALRNADPIHVVEAGEFVLGYPDNRGYIPPTPTLPARLDPAGRLPALVNNRSDNRQDEATANRDLGRNGTFLAIRQLEQDVDAFWDFCRAEGKRLQAFFPPGITAPPEEYIAAKIVGRWRDGSPLVRYSRYPATNAPVPAHPLARTGAGAGGATHIAAAPVQAIRQVQAAAAASSGGEDRHPSGHAGAQWQARFEPDNDFLFGKEDPQAVRCPFGAHIRRANPRESFDPGSKEQLDITNRHRIMRVGRFYAPQQGQKKGLFFMCLNGDLERQFEFVQQTWIQGPSFHGLSGERDPLIGERGGYSGYTVPTRDGPLQLQELADFVRTRGGGYFFLPGRRTLDYLAT